MPSRDKPFRFEVVTPSGRFSAAEAVGVIFPAADGMVGVLHGRAPLIAAMGFGLLTVEHADGETRQYYVAGGFAHVREDVMTILADTCLLVSELDPEGIWDEIQQARRMSVETDEQALRRDEVLAKARTRFRLAQRHRRETGGLAVRAGPEE